MYIFKTDNERIQLNANYANALRKNNSVTNELLSIGSDDAPVYFSNGVPKIATNMINHSDIDALLRGDDIGEQDFTVESNGNIPDAGLIPSIIDNSNLIIEFTFDTGEKKAYLAGVYYHYEHPDDYTTYVQTLIKNNFFSILIEAYEYYDEEGMYSHTQYLGSIDSSLSNKISSFRIYKIDATKHIQLSNNINSTSTSMAATPLAVKRVYDVASAALPKTGGAMTGSLTVDGTISGTVLKHTSYDTPMEIGKYIDFHTPDDAANTDYASRLLAGSDGKLYIMPINQTQKEILHTGNKSLITPADIGAEVAATNVKAINFGSGVQHVITGYEVGDNGIIYGLSTERFYPPTVPSIREPNIGSSFGVPTSIDYISDISYNAMYNSYDLTTGKLPLDDATSTSRGIMSAEDKAKLDGIATGATANTGTITGVSAGAGLSGGGSSGSVTLTNAGVRSITQDSTDGHKLIVNTGGINNTIIIPDNSSSEENLSIQTVSYYGTTQQDGTTININFPNFDPYIVWITNKNNSITIKAGPFINWYQVGTSPQATASTTDSSNYTLTVQVSYTLKEGYLNIFGAPFFLNFSGDTYYAMAIGVKQS